MTEYPFVWFIWPMVSDEIALLWFVVVIARCDFETTSSRPTQRRAEDDYARAPTLRGDV